jgi:predicted acyl esterase
MIFEFRSLATLLALWLACAADFSDRTYEAMVEMRDGVKLHTRVVFPKDHEGKKFTAIVDRSPYGYTGLEWIAGECLVAAGFSC